MKKLLYQLQFPKLFVNLRFCICERTAVVNNCIMTCMPVITVPVSAQADISLYGYGGKYWGFSVAFLLRGICN